jgi:hypothetical protein
MLHGRWHFVMAQVGPSEPDAKTGCRRFQRESNLIAGMKTNADT